MTRRYILCAGRCVGAGALLCAILAASISVQAFAQPGDDVKNRIDAQLAVQKALQEGLDQIQRGNYQAAVYALEHDVARIDGNKKYLAALALAYRGYIRELQQTNHIAEAETYRKRLEILDPGSRIERPASAVAIQPAPSETSVVKAPDKQAALPDVLPTSTQTANPIATGKQPAKEQATGAPINARAKIDDNPPHKSEDLVGDANHKSSPDAAALIERATQDFIAKRYAEAAKSYEQAHKLDAAATQACQEQWAYCKMFVVSDALRHAPVNGPSAQDMEREINQAIAMTPKLEAFGKTLLKGLQERTTLTAAQTGDDNTVVEMKHTPRQGQGWAMVETANFRILHNQPKEVAEKAARIAETTRLMLSHKWFGDDGEVWNPRCDIYLFATAEEYSHETRGGDMRSPGHSNMTIESGHVISRTIYLHVDHVETFNSVLPHETTHVVIAGRFDGIQVPRWADEGMAVLTEPQHRIDRYLRNLSSQDHDHLLFPVGQLMMMNDYPEARLVDPFYTQSVSLVDFLSHEKGPQVFARFLNEGLHSGYEPALRKHYKMQNFAELEKRWRAFAFADRDKQQ